MAPSATSALLSPPKSRPGLRRLSSMTVTEREIKEGGGPVVIVPDRMMKQRSLSHSGGFAASLETARNELSTMNLEEEALASPTSSTPDTPGSPVTPADIPTADSFAFAFDIDGVLIRGGRPIPEAIEAMKMLNALPGTIGGIYADFFLFHPLVPSQDWSSNTDDLVEWWWKD